MQIMKSYDLTQMIRLHQTVKGDRTQRNHLH